MTPWNIEERTASLLLSANSSVLDRKYYLISGIK